MTSMRDGWVLAPKLVSLIALNLMGQPLLETLYVAERG